MKKETKILLIVTIILTVFTVVIIKNIEPYKSYRKFDTIVYTDGYQDDPKFRICIDKDVQTIRAFVACMEKE